MTNLVMAILFTLVPLQDGSLGLSITNVSQMTLEQCMDSAKEINGNAEPYILLCGPIVPKAEANAQ
jgi:hypothetical protein